MGEGRKLRRDQVWIAARVLAVLLPIGLLLSVPWLDSPWTETQRLRATVVGLTQNPSRRAPRTRWLVRLPDGRTVELRGSIGLPGYREGLEVLVIESRSRVLRRLRYDYGGPWGSLPGAPARE